MSDQATKINEEGKIELPKTFETAEGAKLTDTEKSQLSRERILDWYGRKKFEKLKGLQDALVGATYSEREEIKKIIIENTRTELAKHEEIVMEERNRRAEKFAEEIVGVAGGIGNIDLVVSKYEKQQLDEDLFFGTLKSYVGKENNRKMLEKIMASSNFKQILGTLGEGNSKELEFAINQGDFEKVSQIMVNASGGTLSKKDINNYAAVSVFETGMEKKTGVGVIDGVIQGFDKLRNVGHLTVLNSAAEDLKIPFPFILHLGMKTLREVREMDDNLQNNKYLIENKKDSLPLDANRLEFIKKINELRHHLDGKSDEKGIKESFKNSLHIYLQKKEGLTDEDRIQIENEAKFEDLTLIQIFDLVYGSPEDREKWIIKSLSEAPKMWKAYKQVFLDPVNIRNTMKEYHKKRIGEWAVNGFSGGARKWQMGGILKNIDDLEQMLAKGPKSTSNVKEFDNLFRRAGADKYKIQTSAVDAKMFEINRSGKADKIIAEEMLEHDNLVKRYHSLVQEATKIMTNEAFRVIEAGKGLEQIQRGAGDKFLTNTLDKLPNVSDQTLKTIFGDISKIDKTKISGGDLVAAYTKKLVDINSMKEITRARFAVLADVIDSNVATPFGAKWSETRALAKGTATMEAQKGQLNRIEDLVKPTPTKYYAKTYGLPVIILGVEMSYLATGKAKSKEVLWDLGEAAGSFCPFLGTALDIRGAWQGASLSGKKLSTKERWMYAGFAAVGVVADVATLIGGIGLGLRAGLGGVRSGRRAVQIGKELDAANSLRKTAYVEDAPWIQRQIASGASFFNRTNRAEASTEAIMSARAMDQASLIGALGKNHTYGSLESLDDVNTALKTASGADIGKLNKLQKFYKEVSGGVNYMEVMKTYGNAVKVPEGFFGKAWYATLSAFGKMKAYLISIGIPADTLKAYENSFDAVKAAEAVKLTAVQDLAAFYKLKQAEQVKAGEAFTELYNTGLKFTGFEKKYAELVKQSSEASRKTISLEENAKQLKSGYDNLVNKMTPAVAAKLPKKVTQAEVDVAKIMHQKANAEWMESVNNTKKLENEKTLAGSQIPRTNAESVAWKKSLEEADKTLLNVDREIILKEGVVKNAELALYNTNSTRSLMQMEMIQKAEDASHVANSLSMVTRGLQTGGLVMGGIWAITAGTYGPAEQYEFAKGAVSSGAKVAGVVGNELFIEDHSGQPAIDQMVEARVGAVKHKKSMFAALEKAKQVGEDPAVMLARNWEDNTAKELATKHGYYDKVQKILAEGKVDVGQPTTALKEVASGDADGRVKEKIVG